MLKNKCNKTIACDVTESSLKIVKITGIVMSRIPVMHLGVKRCPKGLGFVRYTNKEIDRVCERTNLERFSTQYGFHPQTVAAVINDNPHIHQKQLFMTLSWFKLYDTELVMESRWKWHPETIRNILYEVCRQLAARKADMIVFCDFSALQVLLASLDCVHFECDEFRTDPGGKWYSHKSNGPGLSYEVCVDTVKDRIV